MRARHATTAGAALATALGAVPHASPADWQQYLSQPLSPGAIALLVEHSSDPRVRERWSQALKDRRPAVRATAARAVNVTASVSLVPDLTAALAVETDRTAAAELRRALAALDPRRRDPAASTVPSEDRPVTWRTPEGFPPGLAPDVLRVSGCRPGKKDSYHGGRVSYGSDGRPRQVTMLAPERVDGACAQAVEALVSLALAPGEAVRPGGHAELLIVPLAADAFACMGEQPPEGPPAPFPVGDQIQEPRKVRHVKPWYPDAALRVRARGTVALEAVLSTSGCIRSLKLLSSAHPQLDLVALLTVAQWRYTPTLLNGVPVPVIMTVTVNFRLN